MKPASAFVVGIVLTLVVMFAARSLLPAPNELDAGTYQAALATLTEQRDEARARADSALGVGFRLDTVLVAVTDTVRVVIQAAQAVANEAADSLHVTLDSSQAALLDTILVAHAAEVAAVWRLADERLLWGQSWRDVALKADSTAVAERVRADLIETFQASETRRANRVKRERDMAIVLNVIQAGATLVGKVAS